MRQYTNNDKIAPTYWQGTSGGRTSTAPTGDGEVVNIFTLNFTEADRDNQRDANPDLSQFLFYSNNPFAICDHFFASTGKIQNDDLKILGFVRYINDEWTEAHLLGIGDTVQLQPDAFMNYASWKDTVEVNNVYELWHQEGKGFELLSSEFGTFENKNFYIRIATVAVSDIERNDNDLIETITFAIVENHNELYLRR